MVRAVGLEPTRGFPLRILSPICLPFHHARLRHATLKGFARCLQHDIWENAPVAGPIATPARA